MPVAARIPAANHPAKERKLRLHGFIAHKLGVGIVGGEYRPGQLLAQELVASKRLKVSRSAYREAIRILAAKGLVESLPKTGTRISARSRWQLLDPDVLHWLFETEPDDRLIQGLFELRMVVEPAAAAFAAARRTDAHLSAMSQGLEAMKLHGLGNEAGRIGDSNFHTALLAATENEMLASLSSGISAAVHWTTVYKMRATPLPRDPIPAHVRVYEAIREGNPDAARIAMSDLLRVALADTQESRPKVRASEASLKRGRKARAHR